MKVKYCEPVSLPNYVKLTKFIDFIDQLCVDDGTNQMVMRNRYGADQHTITGVEDNIIDEYPNLFEDLQSTLGIEPLITDLLFWKAPANRDLPDPYNTIHKDGVHSIPITREYAITIPIKNCDGIKVSWYEDKDPEQTKLIDFPVITAADHNDLIKVHERYLTEPMILRIDSWHNVYNESDEPAYMVSIRFDPTFDLPSAFLTGSP